MFPQELQLERGLRPVYPSYEPQRSLLPRGQGLRAKAFLFLLLLRFHVWKSYSRHLFVLTDCDCLDERVNEINVLQRSIKTLENKRSDTLSSAITACAIIPIE